MQTPAGGHGRSVWLARVRPACEPERLGASGSTERITSRYRQARPPVRTIQPLITMTKSLLLLFVLCASRFAAQAQDTSDLAEPPDGDNQKAEVSQWIGPVKITIGYHSPRVHFHAAERTGHIWGELVPYGFTNDGLGLPNLHPWRAGANESTQITFSHDVKIEGKDVKAGTYGLFLAPEKAASWFPAQR